MWEPPNVNIIHYTVYYNSTNDIKSINFTSTATNGTINGLTNATNYVFRISATYEVSSGVYQEGPLSPSVSPGMPFSINANCYVLSRLDSCCKNSDSYNTYAFIIIIM